MAGSWQCPPVKIAKQCPDNVLPEVALHQQDDKNDCGAACAQMLLHELGRKLSDPSLDQTKLLTQGKSGACEGGWRGLDPCGLAFILNNSQPQGGANLKFRPYQYRGKRDMERRIAWTVHKTQQAPAVAVQGGLHWLLVTGYQADELPSNANDDYKILGFMINNSVPEVPQILYLQAHDDGTDKCGYGWIAATDEQGNVLEDGDGNPIFVDRGTMGHHVSYTSWHCEYLAKPVVIKGQFTGKYVAVCVDTGDENMNKKQQRVRCPRQRATIISDHDAMCAAIAGLQEAQLDQHPLWQPVMVSPNPDKPILITREDEITPWYFFVRMKSQDGRMPITVRVDAYSPTYLESWAVPGSATLATPPVDTSHTSLLERMIRRLGGITREDGTLVPLRLEDEDVQVGEHAIWKPCLESLSPANPFYVIHRGTSRYFVRASDVGGSDRLRGFTKLTTDVAGV